MLRRRRRAQEAGEAKRVRRGATEKRDDANRVAAARTGSAGGRGARAQGRCARNATHAVRCHLRLRCMKKKEAKLTELRPLPPMATRCLRAQTEAQAQDVRPT